MSSFLAGVAVAIVLALVAGFGLNAFDTPTAEKQKTEETVL